MSPRVRGAAGPADDVHRSALGEISQKLARADVMALETQGRFIKSRYGDESVEKSPGAVD